jgi:acetyl-CoA carboxylase carboxyl transferase subunit beta
MWFKKKVKARPEEKLKLPDGLWVKCETCGEILYRKELEKNLWICPKCNFHFRINHHNYISLLLDGAKLKEKDKDLEPLDPLDFPEYKKKQKIAQEHLVAPGCKREFFP